MTYIPPTLPDDEASIFAHYASGINFDKYDDITVDITGSNPLPAIMVMRLWPFFISNINIIIKAFGMSLEMVSHPTSDI